MKGLEEHVEQLAATSSAFITELPEKKNERQFSPRILQKEFDYNAADKLSKNEAPLYTTQLSSAGPGSQQNKAMFDDPFLFT